GQGARESWVVVDDQGAGQSRSFPRNAGKASALGPVDSAEDSIFRSIEEYTTLRAPGLCHHLLVSRTLSRASLVPAASAQERFELIRFLQFSRFLHYLDSMDTDRTSAHANLVWHSTTLRRFIVEFLCSAKRAWHSPCSYSF